MAVQGQQISGNFPPFANKEKIVKKVIDYKLDNGKKFYKVKWESSWEAEDNLLKYQNLLDQFWGFVNRVKSEDIRDPLRKKPRIQLENDEQVRYEEGLAPQSSAKESKSINPAEEHNVGTIIKPRILSSVKHEVAKSVKSAATTVSGHVVQNVDAQTRDEEEKAKSNVADVHFTKDANDLALRWENPFVRIAFVCRICSEEQAFFETEERWKKHFMMHIRLRPEDEEDTCSTKCTTNVLTKEDVHLFTDPEKPIIQKVEHLIQKWGVNQYVRLVFLCRACGKEQQAQHTGNWRSHFMSHRFSHTCNICSTTFKSKNDLKRHNKIYHEDKETEVRPHSCRICLKLFKRRFDMKRHIAQVHSIDPEHITLQEVRKKQEDEAAKQKLPKNFVPSIGTSLFSKPLGDSATSPYEEKRPYITNTVKLGAVPSLTAVSSSNEVSSSVGRNYICGTCFQIFKSKEKLNSHQLKSHCLNLTDSEGRDNNCGVCGRSFKRMYDLNRHTSLVHSMDFEQAKLINENDVDDAVNDVDDAVNDVDDAVNDGQYATMCDVSKSSRQTTDSFFSLSPNCDLSFIGEDCVVVKEEPDASIGDEKEEIELIIDEKAPV